MSKNEEKGASKRQISESTYRLLSLAIQATIPLAVIVVGTQVQSSIATANVAQQYTAMAMEILRESHEETSDELRVWAATTVEKYSPVKISDALMGSLMQRGIDIPSIIIRVPDVPDWLMEPPKTYPADGKITFGDILVDYAYERERMIALQNYLSEVQAIYGTTEGLTDELDQIGERLEAQWAERDDQLNILKEITKQDAKE